MFAVFQCVALAIKNKGIRGLTELVPGGSYILDVAQEAFRILRERRKDAKLKEELAKVAAASVEEARKAAAEVAREVVDGGSVEDRIALELYLTRIPDAVRASLKRADDPSGRTVPPGLALDSPDDLARMLPRRAPLFRPGAELPGRSGWTLEELLGAGGFGEVWLARHSFIPQPRAVKFCTDPRTRTRLASHEGKVIARVMGHRNHPNVVPLLDAALDGETPWLMYEYVGGGNLTDLILRWQRLPASEREARAVAALRQLAAAVGSFHRLAPPIVHRDLKPANILLADGRDDFCLRITDFGIGGVAAEDAHAAGPAGQSPVPAATGVLETALRGSYTPLYASPQQRAGRPPDPRDDVHALGVIGFHLFTGRLGEAPGVDAADDLREAGAGAPFIELVAKCVASKPERRPKDGVELAERLAELARPARATRPVEPAPVMPPRRAPEPSPGPTERAKGPEAVGGVRCVVPVRGFWFARPAADPDAPWPATGTKVPTEVVAKAGEVYRLALNPDTTTDAELAKLRALADFPGLEAVDLSGCKLVTDAGLLHLAHLGSLRAVTLADTRVTDAGLALLLARLSQLEAVGLAGAANVSPAVIPDLMRLRNLKRLALPPRADNIDVRVEFAGRRPGCKVV
jgi:tRNA A-37 threonylcarbamoyl transferase component Bud32